MSEKFLTAAAILFEVFFLKINCKSRNSVILYFK